MPRSRGELRSLAFNLNTRELHGRLAGGSALLALALGASLLSARPRVLRRARSSIPARWP